MSNKGYFLIADISGYTEFVKLHNMQKKPLFGKIIAKNFENHASVIISDLLESVIDAIEPVMKLNKLEGDAAFFYSHETEAKYQSDEIIKVMEKANQAFYKKASELVFVQACGCEPCSQSKNLRLKIVAHRGNFIIQNIRNFEEISGEAIILTHRLLKNNLASNEYWLVTKEFSKNLSKEQKRRFSTSSHTLESFGNLKLDHIKFNTGDPVNEEITRRSRVINWLSQASYFAKATMRRSARRI